MRYARALLKCSTEACLEDKVYQDMQTTRSIIFLTRNLGYSITNASAAQQAKAASAGMGGHTSVGGGGGFSGGGFGGGAR